ncbi:MAG TPA: hypothetical protein VIO11_00190 [Candidatus Methanoperedens sp.]
MKTKKHKKRIIAGIILCLILVSVVPAMAEDVALNPIQPTTAGSFKQVSWSYSGVFEPNASLDLFSDGILNRTIVSETPLAMRNYYWAIPLSLQGLYQIKITANTTAGQELSNTTDIQITTPSEQGCRYCHTTTGTSNSGYYDNTLGDLRARHHVLVNMAVINPITNQPYACADCHPATVDNGILIDRNCLDCHNGTAFWANPSKINPGEPHLNIPQPPPLPPDTPNIIVTSPMTGDKWVRGTTQTIRWMYTGNLGNYAKIELLEQGRVDQTWNNVPQSNGIGSYDWAIPSQFEVSTYQIRVSAGGNSNTTGNFNIVKR